MNNRPTVALIYDFDGTLAPGNMQEYDFIPAVGKSNKEFWHEANKLAEEQDADQVLTYMARMIQEAQSKGLSLRREAFRESGRKGGAVRRRGGSGSRVSTATARSTAPASCTISTRRV